MVIQGRAARKIGIAELATAIGRHGRVARQLLSGSAKCASPTKRVPQACASVSTCCAWTLRVVFVARDLSAALVTAMTTVWGTVAVSVANAQTDKKGARACCRETVYLGGAYFGLVKRGRSGPSATLTSSARVTWCVDSENVLTGGPVRPATRGR